MLRRLFALFVAVPLFAIPASGQAVATVCKDGTTTATTGRGACTGHGGVDKNAAKKAAKAAKAEQKAAKSAVQKPAATMAPAAAARPATRPTPAVSAPARTAPPPVATAPRAPAPRAAAPAASTVRAANTDPTGATAQCKDGTYSHSTNRRGACSRHQGVAKWL